MMIFYEFLMFANQVLPYTEISQTLITPYLLLGNQEQKTGFIDQIELSGCTCQQVIAGVHKWAINNTNLKDNKKAAICILTADIESNVMEGGKDSLNLLLYFEKLARILKN